MSSPGSQLRRNPAGGSGARLLAQMGIALYALFASFIIIRSLLLSIGIADNLWVGGVIYGITDPFAAVLKIFPGGDFELVGRLTLADLTLLAGIVAVPAAIVARRPEY
ncbi:MAG: hypothetical protein IT335_09565 [Thermomicrobiales bacterium]|nr:hypothetical protein [Thermomicrobiales bacterium]